MTGKRGASQCGAFNDVISVLDEFRKTADGSVKLTNLISGPEELLNKGRLFSVITLEPGCGIGYHVHDIIVEPGNGHGITNRTNEICELVALILYQ